MLNSWDRRNGSNYYWSWGDAQRGIEAVARYSSK